MRFPVDNFETQWNLTAGNSFGQKVDYGYHEASDLNLNGGGNIDLGQPLYAIADGEISSVHSHIGSPTFGKHLHLKFNLEGKDYWAHYAHCNEILVTEGTKVKKGDKIATCGNSGTTFAHLHFAIKNQPTGVDGIAKTLDDLKKWEDPMPFIKKHFVEIKTVIITQEELDQMRKDRDTHYNNLQEEKKNVEQLRKDLLQEQEHSKELLKRLEIISDQETSTSEQLLACEHSRQPLKDEILAINRALGLMDDTDSQTALKALQLLKESKVKPMKKPVTLLEKLQFLFS